jgi:hypothetical protein
LNNFEDHGKATQAAQQVADRFLAAMRDRVEASPESIVWYGPGQLLVMGDAKLQAEVAKVLSMLSDDQREPAGEHAKVFAAARKRAAGRREAVQQAERRRRRIRVAAAHERFGQQLLAAAAGGELDLQALTELQIAWNRPESAALLNGEAAVLLLRSCWMLQEASRALPEAVELRALAEKARETTREAAQRAVVQLSEKPEDAAAFAATLYAALGRRDEATFLGQALPLLTETRGADSPLANPRVLAAGLLQPPSKIDREALTRVINQGPVGDDMVLLVAFAARRAGGNAWETFRVTSRSLLPQQPLSGHVLVLINRLEGAALPTLASR